jgi:uncharacterized protein (DUF1501 family)
MSEKTRKSRPSAPAIGGDVTRRHAMSMSAVAAAAGTPFAATLAGIGSAAAQTATDYKALICFYQFGGNDNSNTVMPASGEAYADYRDARPNLAIPGNRILRINPIGNRGPALGVSPHLPKIRALFEQGRCAVMANVGPLNFPTSKAEYEAGLKSLPFQLFSHSDQTGAWHTGLPDRPSRTGWLGRMADIVGPVFSEPNSIPMQMSISGQNTMQVGAEAQQYQVSIYGPVPVYWTKPYGTFTPEIGDAMRTLMTRTTPHVMHRALTTIGKRALDSEVILTGALRTAPRLRTAFPNTWLGLQAQMVAKLIQVNQKLGHRRQVFFISTGGWDFHGDLLAEQGERLTEVDDALAALYGATVEMGLANNVTTFTASEFGRALQYNGRGSDHGWGGHHFVIGGAVRGKKVYGSFPTVAVGGPEDAGQGSLIPTTSVDQYAATLAAWFGVDPTSLATMLPNIGRFNNQNLGFMA